MVTGQGDAHGAVDGRDTHLAVIDGMPYGAAPSDAPPDAPPPVFVRVVTVKRGDTAQSLAATMATSGDKYARFLALNGRDSPALVPGQSVKIIRQ